MKKKKKNVRSTPVDMTDTIVAFAKPLLERIPPEDEEQLARLFGRVIEIWNMWVASAPPWNDSRGLDEVKAAISGGELTPAEIYIHRLLAERWVTLFRNDGRLVVDSSVDVEDGTPVFRCFGCTATPELLEAFKGTPS